jgi:hypothetical protein
MICLINAQKAVTQKSLTLIRCCVSRDLSGGISNIGAGLISPQKVYLRADPARLQQILEPHQERVKFTPDTVGLVST